MSRLVDVALFHFNLFCVWNIKRSCLGNFYTFYENMRTGVFALGKTFLGCFLCIIGIKYPLSVTYNRNLYAAVGSLLLGSP